MTPRLPENENERILALCFLGYSSNMILKHLKKNGIPLSCSSVILHMKNDSGTALENSKEKSRKPKPKGRKVTKLAIIRKLKESIQSHNQIPLRARTQRLGASQTTVIASSMRVHVQKRGRNRKLTKKPIAVRKERSLDFAKCLEREKLHYTSAMDEAKLSLDLQNCVADHCYEVPHHGADTSAPPTKSRAHGFLKSVMCAGCICYRGQFVYTLWNQGLKVN